MLIGGFLLYCANYTVGILARTGRFRNRHVHRILFVLNIAAAAAITIFRFQFLFGLTLAALATMPFSKPRGALHPVLATVGLAGYLLTLIDSLIINII